MTETDVTNNGSDSGIPDSSTTGYGFSDFLNSLKGLAGTANSLYSNVKGQNQQTQADQNALAANSVSVSLMRALPWIIGGGIVLVLVLVFSRRK